jgi:hypothetical protein
MSKKSRKRNKKILGLLGALGAGLAMANRKPKQSSVSVESVRDSGLRPTVDDMEFKETVVEPIVIPKKKPVVVSVPVGKMRGTGSDESAIAGQNKRAAYAQSMRAPKNVMGPFDYMQPRRSSIMAKPGLNRMSDDMGFKKGGRVGCGKAKRGFGRAMKGKK